MSELETVRIMLLQMPNSYKNRFDALYNLFCSGSHLYSWQEGAINISNIFDINSNYEKDLYNFKSNNEYRIQSFTLSGASTEIIERAKRNYKEGMYNILNVEERLNDSNIPDDMNFFAISPDSCIFNVPEDIQQDWLDAAFLIYIALDMNYDILSSHNKEMFQKLDNERTW